MGDSRGVRALAANDAELGSLRRTFYDEADERLLELEALLLEFDGQAFDLERMNTVFRAVHSIKGGSAACELATIVRFAHTFESLLDALRKQRIELGVDVVDVMLQSTDVLASLVQGSRNGDYQSDWGAEEAVERIRAALENGTEIRPSERPEQGLADAGFVLFDDESVNEPTTTPAQARLSLRAPPLRAPSLRAPSLPAPSLRAPSQRPPSQRVPSQRAPSQRAASRLSLRAAELRLSMRMPPPSGSMPAAEGLAASLDSTMLSSPAPEPSARLDYSEDQDAHAHALISEAALARMVTLAIDLQQSSARFSEQLSAQSELTAVQLAEIARQIEREVGELESLLTLARGGDSATLLECIVIRLGGALYAVPLTAVHRYFTPQNGDLRSIPTLGTVLMAGSEVLRVVETRFAAPSHDETTELRQRVAISLSLAGRPSVLLVDEVLVQVKLLVRGLEANYQRVDGFLGAAPYGSRVVLVLDLETLSRRSRAS